MPDSATIQFIKPYKRQLLKSMNEFLAVLDTTYQKGKPNGNLNNLCADLILEYTQSKMQENHIAFCVLNYGGLRSSLPSDSIFVKHIFELSPFENHLVVLKLEPQNYDSLFRYLRLRESDPISGLQINLNSARVKIQGRAFDSRRPIYFVTNDYMANGGDGFGILKGAEYRKDLDETLRQALINALKEEYKTTGSIKRRTVNPFIYE